MYDEYDYYSEYSASACFSIGQGGNCGADCPIFQHGNCEEHFREVLEDLSNGHCSEEELLETIHAYSDKLTDVEVEELVGYDKYLKYIEENNLENEVTIETFIKESAMTKPSQSVANLADIIEGLDGKPAPAVISAAKSAPSSDIFFPKGVKEKLEIAIKSRSNVLMVGPPGCGKSTLARVVLEDLGMHYDRVQYHRDMDAQDHIGSVTLTEKGGASVTEIAWSPNIHAMENGTVILGDEFDSLNPATSFPLFAQWDDSKSLTVQCNGVSRFVKKHPDFFVICTANTNGTGDDDGEFGGTDIQNAALLDRFDFVIYVDYLEPSKEIKLLKGKIPEIAESDLAKMVDVAKSTRAKTSTVKAMSTRRIIAWAKAFVAATANGGSKAKAFETSAEMAILNQAPDQGTEFALREFMNSKGITVAKGGR